MSLLVEVKGCGTYLLTQQAVVHHGADSKTFCRCAGDIAALLASGWSTKRVALVNFSSACVAFLGLYMGIPIATALDAQTWILATAMGMFLYVGLANIVRKYFCGKPFLDHEFLSCTRHPSYREDT